MAIKELTQENGRISGLLIPVEDVRELRNDLKEDSRFLDYLDGFLSKQQVIEPRADNGISVEVTNQAASEITTKLYQYAFSKDVPMFYRDSRVKTSTEFIRANPDGSEDLVSFDLQTDSYTLIKKLLPKGKGVWAFLSKKRIIRYEAPIFYHCGT